MNLLSRVCLWSPAPAAAVFWGRFFFSSFEVHYLSHPCYIQGNTLRRFDILAATEDGHNLQRHSTQAGRRAGGNSRGKTVSWTTAVRNVSHQRQEREGRGKGVKGTTRPPAFLVGSPKAVSSMMLRHLSTPGWWQLQQCLSSLSVTTYLNHLGQRARPVNKRAVERNFWGKLLFGIKLEWRLRNPNHLYPPPQSSWIV